jgi:hypothetical protein
LVQAAQVEAAKVEALQAATAFFLLSHQTAVAVALLAETRDCPAVQAVAAHILPLAEQAQQRKATTDKQAAHQQQAQAVEQAEHLQDFPAALQVLQ